MRQVQLGYSYMTDEIGMRSAFGQFARQLAEQLVTANAVGRFEKPVLGPLTNAVKSGAKWTEEYPAWQKDADEFEKLLQFAQRNCVFAYYCNDLRLSDDRRNSALMELRVGLHLEQSGFGLVKWDPEGYEGAKGEFTVEGPDKQHDVFVEVKSPSYKGEVFDWKGKTRSTSQLARVKQPKHLDGEGGAVAPWQGVRYAVDKAYNQQSKFRADTPNLLVVADDMFVSATRRSELTAFQALYSTYQTDPGYFTDKRCERLGGVGLFGVNQQLVEPDVTYQMTLFLNPNSLPGTKLPLDLCRAFGGMTLPSE